RRLARGREPGCEDAGRDRVGGRGEREGGENSRGPERRPCSHGATTLRQNHCSMRVLVVDNYDSFTYNLVQFLGELGAELEVVRNDRAEVGELLERGADRLVVSPGPCTPAEAGI